MRSRNPGANRTDLFFCAQWRGRQRHAARPGELDGVRAEMGGRRPSAGVGHFCRHFAGDENGMAVVDVPGRAVGRDSGNCCHCVSGARHTRIAAQECRK